MVKLKIVSDNGHKHFTKVFFDDQLIGWVRDLNFKTDSDGYIRMIVTAIVDNLEIELEVKKGNVTCKEVFKK